MTEESAPARPAAVERPPAKEQSAAERVSDMRPTPDAGDPALPAIEPEPMTPTDVELVQRMARGDRSALGALYDRHSPLLLGLAERMVGRGHEAEDIIQDVFLEVWRRSSDYDPGRGSVKTWLLLRARSRCLDLKKSARVSRRAQGSDGVWLAELIDPHAEPSLAPDQNRLRRALAGLSVEQRTILLLGYFEGLSSSEMAERLGIPVGTVKSRTAAALAALRAALGDPR